METSTSMMVVMTLTVCNASKQDAFHGRQACGHAAACQAGTHGASVIPSKIANPNRAHRPFGCLWRTLSSQIVEFVRHRFVLRGSGFCNRCGGRAEEFARDGANEGQAVRR